MKYIFVDHMREKIRERNSEDGSQLRIAIAEIFAQ